MLGGTNGKKEIVAKNAVLISMASILLLFCIGITLKAIYCNENYSVVPNIYRMTYDNALSSLREADLDGRLALASTNGNLANADTRVVWQSKDAGGIVAKGTNVMFVIDDNFAIEFVPLTAYQLSKNPKAIWCITGIGWQINQTRTG